MCYLFLYGGFMFGKRGGIGNIGGMLIGNWGNYGNRDGWMDEKVEGL